MKLIALSFFLLITLNFNLTLAESEKKDDSSKNKGSLESNFNINEACKDSSSKSICESTLKSIGADKDEMKTSKVAEKLVKHSQSEFGDIAQKVRSKMREDDLDKKVKKALSHCVKMYLDIADVLRGSYVAVKTKKYGHDLDKFIQMAHKFPQHCEDSLEKAGTDGKKLGLYDTFKELEDLATTMDAVIRHAASANNADAKN